MRGCGTRIDHAIRVVRRVPGAARGRRHLRRDSLFRVDGSFRPALVGI